MAIRKAIGKAIVKNDRTKAWLATVEEGQKDLLTQTGLVYTSEVRRLMVESPRGGRVYGIHKASAPGEPPAVDTGQLVKSIGYRLTKIKEGWGVEAGSSIPKRAFWLEFGTVKIAARPAWRPALKVAEKFLRNEIKAFKKRKGRMA